MKELGVISHDFPILIEQKDDNRSSDLEELSSKTPSYVSNTFHDPTQSLSHHFYQPHMHHGKSEEKKDEIELKNYFRSANTYRFRSKSNQSSGLFKYRQSSQPDLIPLSLSSSSSSSSASSYIFDPSELQHYFSNQQNNRNSHNHIKHIYDSLHPHNKLVKRTRKIVHNPY